MPTSHSTNCCYRCYRCYRCCYYYSRNCLRLKTQHYSTILIRYFLNFSCWLLPWTWLSPKRPLTGSRRPSHPSHCPRLVFHWHRRYRFAPTQKFLKLPELLAPPDPLLPELPPTMPIRASTSQRPTVLEALSSVPFSTTYSITSPRSTSASTRLRPDSLVGQEGRPIAGLPGPAGSDYGQERHQHRQISENPPPRRRTFQNDLLAESKLFWHLLQTRSLENLEKAARMTRVPGNFGAHACDGSATIVCCTKVTSLSAGRTGGQRPESRNLNLFSANARDFGHPFEDIPAFFAKAAGSGF